MRNIILPNKELRLLSAQLQNFNQGYTVEQIRSLDRVVRTMETTLKPFADGLDKLSRILVSQLSEKAKQEGEAKKQEKIVKYFDTEGNKTANCSLEDIDFEFVKAVWSRMSTFSGAKEAREAILKIDDAIRSAEEPVFKKGVN